MKLSFADITENRLHFNSHKNHNPYCDILELHISRDAFITYYIELKTGNEGLEYYSGENYVVNSTAKSHSAHYPKDKIPKKYISVWHGLKEKYNNDYKNKKEVQTILK